uniref:CAG pathogenicity island protein 23 (Protein PicB) n=1 Tax=Ganoderma boninense TaxID=34458 RepID=A0A5K1K590_9APHY|nr:CAG pathogenicity island protein 23 (Protein PicB) [Ganoderma boninense]
MFSTTGSPSFAETECAPELLAQEFGYPAGLYPAWVLRSVLRKAEERMRDMIVEANAHGFGPAVGYAMKSLSQPTAHVREADDDEDDASASTSVSTASVSTETDGSSVHTPTDSPIRSIFSPGIVTPPGGAPRLSSLDTKALPQVPRSPSPPSPTFDFDMSTYHTLSTMRSRLLHILARMDSSPRQISSGSRYGSDLTILEIKSRRRAWSCRDYVGGARMHLVGLATPVYSSPLARCEPVTAETVARLQAQAGPSLIASPSVVGLADLSEEFGVKLGMRAVTKEMDTQLFPVCEEEEEDEMIEVTNASFYQTSSRGYSLDDDFSDDESWREVRDFDLESGLLAFPRPASPEKSAPAPTYAHLHPMARTRTRSMRQEPHPRLPSNALLCQPLNVKVPVPVMLNHDDSLDVDVERGLGGEFTLSMDLPPPPRGWLQGDADVACR